MQLDLNRWNERTGVMRIHGAPGGEALLSDAAVAELRSSLMGAAASAIYSAPSAPVEPETVTFDGWAIVRTGPGWPHHAVWVAGDLVLVGDAPTPVRDPQLARLYASPQTPKNTTCSKCSGTGNAAQLGGWFACDQCGGSGHV